MESFLYSSHTLTMLLLHIHFMITIDVININKILEYFFSKVPIPLSLPLGFYPTAYMLHMETISHAIWAWLRWKMFDVYQDVCCDVITRLMSTGSIIWEQVGGVPLQTEAFQMMVQKTSSEFILKVCWSPDMVFRTDTQYNVKSSTPTHYHKSVHVSKHFQCCCLMFSKYRQWQEPPKRFWQYRSFGGGLG